ncbi:hypothetical protein [Chryseobacterium sp. StRB126]|uniref:hypothetical protein n=1 Tax=Chryseobacterium sp. StRB126 TaxID=878220 RepID=UPI0005ED891B|nr:hypothetical protein [Chryseobacterium sp. StRB126]
MKAKLLFIFCFLFLKSFSQISNTVKLENLDLPTTPAVVLLDQNVTSIENPKTIKEFGLSVINSFKDNALPQNYAVEFNPYWIFKRNTDIYQYFKDERYSGFTHNQAISFAFIKIDTVQNVSIGYRTNLFRVMSKKYDENLVSLTDKIWILNLLNNAEYERLIQLAEDEKGPIIGNITDMENASSFKEFSTAYRNILLKLKDSSLDIAPLKSIIKKIDSVSSGREKSFDNNKKFLVGLYKKFKADVVTLKFDRAKFSQDNIKAMEEVQKTIVNLSEMKPKFSIDFAGAYNHFWDNKDFSSGRFGRLGAWLTMNYNIDLNKDKNEKEKNYLKLFLLNRYIVDKMKFDKASSTYGNNSFYDIGGKLNFEFNKLSFGYEYIQRFGDDEDYRSVGSIMYRINDNVSLIGGFGKNFENKDNMIATLGLRWGLNFNNDFDTDIPKTNNQ